MSRRMGSRNNGPVQNGPFETHMIRRAPTTTNGYIKFPYPLTMFDACDYYTCEVLGKEGEFDTVIKISAKRISTELALQRLGLSVRSDAKILLDFVSKNKERAVDLQRYLPGNTYDDAPARIDIPREPLTYPELDRLTKRELTELLRDNPRCEFDAVYCVAVKSRLDKIIAEE